MYIPDKGPCEVWRIERKDYIMIVYHPLPKSDTLMIMEFTPNGKEWWFLDIDDLLDMAEEFKKRRASKLTKCETPTS